MAANSGDPPDHSEEEETVVVRGEYADDSDDDDDVERYVFVARKPASADSRDQAQDDVSSGGDGDGGDDAMPGGEAGGARGRKRQLLREMFDASLPPSRKKIRVGLTSPKKRPLLGDMSECSSPSRKKARIGLTPPLAPARPSGSEAVLLPCGEKSGCEVAACGHVSAPEQEGEANNKKCRKRSSESATSEERSRRDVMAAADSGASRRFVCNECGRSFGSHQALGGHVLGHIKKSKKAPVAAATHHDEDVVGGNGNNNVEDAVIAETDGHDEEKATSLSSHGYASGESNSEEEVAMAIVASPHQNDHKIHDADGNAKEKVIVIRRHPKGDSNGRISVRKKEHRCELCGNVYLSGQALGGHMRKHRERPAHDGGEGRSPSPAATGDGETPTDRLAGMIAGEPPAQ